LNEGDDKSTLPDVINAMILKYTHWSDIFMLHSLSDNQKREIEGNKQLIFNLIGISTSRPTTRQIHVTLSMKNYASSMAEARTLKTRYIAHFPKKNVSIVHCDDVFDEEAVVKKMGSAKVNHIHPFVGEVEERVNNFYWVNSRVGI
jgi:hypothetical protein